MGPGKRLRFPVPFARRLSCGIPPSLVRIKFSKINEIKLEG